MDVEEDRSTQCRNRRPSTPAWNARREASGDDHPGAPVTVSTEPERQRWNFVGQRPTNPSGRSNGSDQPLTTPDWFWKPTACGNINLHRRSAGSILWSGESVGSLAGWFILYARCEATSPICMKFGTYMRLIRKNADDALQSADMFSICAEFHRQLLRGQGQTSRSKLSYWKNLKIVIRHLHQNVAIR